MNDRFLYEVNKLEDIKDTTTLINMKKSWNLSNDEMLYVRLAVNRVFANNSRI